MARPRGDIAPRVVHAARARFLREGVDGASLRAIAEDAGTSIGMVYYYHPTKDDLFLAVVEEVYVALLADLDRAVAPGLPVLERLQALFSRIGALTADEKDVVRLVVREALTSATRLERLAERFRRGHFMLLMALVRDAFAEGLYDPALDPALALVATAALAGPAQLVLQAVQKRFGLPAASGPVAPRFVEILLRGLGTGRPAPVKVPRRRAKKSMRGPA